MGIGAFGREPALRREAAYGTNAMKKLIFLLAAGVMPQVVSAELMPPVYDSQLVASDLIVIARIERQTMERSHRDSRVKLIVSRTLRGAAPGEIMDCRVQPMVLVGGYFKGHGVMVNAGRPGDDRKKGPITLCDGRMDIAAKSLDLSKDAIWFLRKSKDGQGYLVPRSQYAQPLKFLAYFQALLSDKPHEAALRLLRHGDADVRLRVLDYLAEMHRPQDAARIAPLLADENESVQARAAKAAAEVGDRSAVPLFRNALSHKNPPVRAAACRFLCRFRDVESVEAIAEAVDGMDPYQLQQVAKHLGRMRSRRAVPVLLGLLDERLPRGRKPGRECYSVSKNAAESLADLTGVRFVLDAPAARRRWDKLKQVRPEVLLRKCILAEIGNLTHRDPRVRWTAYRRLGRLANRHFGSFNAFHSDRKHADARKLSQRLWRQWADEHVTDSRLDWICAGFEAAGITLPRPMTKDGLDLLVKVIAYYRNWSKHDVPAKWKIDGWPRADFHVYNANLLLEQFTGHTVGLCPYHSDLERTWRQRDVLERRWQQWWAAHREKAELRPWPAEQKVTKAMLAAAPDVQPPPTPLQLTLRMEETDYPGGAKPVVHVEIKNISNRPITIARRPAGLMYASKTGSGSAGYSKGAGHRKDDFIALRPGKTIEWNETRAAFSGFTKARAVEDFRYRMTFPLAGSGFGLRAWRGELVSNAVRYTVSP